MKRWARLRARAPRPRAMPALMAALTMALLAVATPRSARAQLDVQRFKPALTHDGVVTAEGSGTRHPDDRWELGLWLNYAKSPLIAADADGNETLSFVSGRLGFDLIASASLSRRLSIGLGLPAFALQSGDVSPSTAGIGDLRVAPKLELLSDLDDGFGLALVAEVRLPTHSGDFSGGESAVEVAPKAVLDHRFASGVRVTANLGAALRSEAQFLNVVAGHELAYAAALGYRIGGLAGATELGLEVVGALGLSESDPEELPLELLGFLRHDFSPEWELVAGPGVGLIEGYGVPTFRAFLGVRFRPTSHDRDSDGVSDSVDECPDDPEDRDGVEDGDGCPEEDLDSDQDGVSDAHDQCPGEKETINGVDDDDGCPDSGSPHVVYEDGRFVVLDTIRFSHGSSDIQPESHSLLNEVALTLKANPEIERMRVEGHTDDTGPREVNMHLSNERAKAVRRYLIGRGVSPHRLKVRSFGPDRPREEGTDDKARARNRRVEFVLE